VLVDYTSLDQDSKVFLYQSSRKFYKNELEEITTKIKSFLNELEITVAFKIEYNRFILFFIDPKNTLSTKTIDNLVTFIFELENKYDVTLLDKVNVCFKQGEFVQYQDMKRFRELIKKKSISKKTIVFNNFIQNKYEFENLWEIPITQSWLSHLFK
jgi:hypothetical protein